MSDAGTPTQPCEHEFCDTGYDVVCRYCLEHPPSAGTPTQPTPKMLRECANILETDPYRRMHEAAWLRHVADESDTVGRLRGEIEADFGV